MTRTDAHPAGSLERAVDETLDAAGARSGDGVVAAVSGGVDSTVLLDLLHRAAPGWGLRLQVAHLDHRLRPESGDDARFVQALAVARGLPCIVAAEDVADRSRRERRSLEAAGRLARRELFDRVRRDTDSRWVALGHNADDQAETVLLHLLRGAGSAGLAAMARVRDDGYLRPLLTHGRDAIRDYARRRGLEFREDPSNLDIDIPRNRVRHELLPHLRRRHNPAVMAALGRTAALLREDEELLAQVARRAADEVLRDREGDRVSLDAAALGGYHITIQRRVLRQYLQELARGVEVGFAMVAAAVDALRSGPAAPRSLGGDLKVQMAGGRCVLRRGEPATVHAQLRLPGRTRIPGRSLALEARFVERVPFERLRKGLGPRRAAFDGRAAEGLLTVRSPRPGDRLQPFGMGGRHKKLSDCFIDAKWPRILRPEALVITRAAAGAPEEILWVAGMARCEAFRVAADTPRILDLELVDER